VRRSRLCRLQRPHEELAPAGAQGLPPRVEKAADPLGITGETEKVATSLRSPLRPSCEPAPNTRCGSASGAGRTRCASGPRPVAIGSGPVGVRAGAPRVAPDVRPQFSNHVRAHGEEVRRGEATVASRIEAEATAPAPPATAARLGRTALGEGVVLAAGERASEDARELDGAGSECGGGAAPFASGGGVPASAPTVISPGTRPCARRESPRASSSAFVGAGTRGRGRRTGRAPSRCRCGTRCRSRARRR
jgi:hypothetical protein